MRRLEPVEPVDSIGDDHATLATIVDLLRQVLARLGASAPVPVRALTVPEAAHALGVSPATAWEMIAAGELASVTVHQRSRRVPVEALDAYLAVQLAREGHGGVASLLAIPAPIPSSPVAASRVVRAPVASYATTQPTRQRVKAPRKGRKAS